MGGVATHCRGEECGVAVGVGVGGWELVLAHGAAGAYGTGHRLGCACAVRAGQRLRHLWCSSRQPAFPRVQLARLTMSDPVFTRNGPVTPCRRTPE